VSVKALVKLKKFKKKWQNLCQKNHANFIYKLSYDTLLCHWMYIKVHICKVWCMNCNCYETKVFYCYETMLRFFNWTKTWYWQSVVVGTHMEGTNVLSMKNHSLLSVFLREFLMQKKWWSSISRCRENGDYS